MTEKEVVSLKEFLETKLRSNEEFFGARIKSIEKANELAAKELGRRLEGMNEFREQLKDQAGTFITRADLEGVSKEIESLKLSRAELHGKADQKSLTTTLIIAIISLVIAFSGIIIALVG